jgi:uncharacterized protein (DUF1778 family)
VKGAAVAVKSRKEDVNAFERRSGKIKDASSWTLAKRDSETFVRALVDPPKPSSRMKEAANRYKRRIAG